MRSIPAQPPPRRLADAGVRIWRIPLEGAEGDGPRAWDSLSGDEIARARKFRFERDRAAFARTRSALRALLGRHLDTPPEKIPIHYEGGGKPFVPLERGDTSLHFSVSHARGLALVAVAWGSELGIDVELVRAIPERASIAAHHFSEEERAWFRPHSSDQAFLGCWTRKEAALKVSGTGLTRPLHTFGIVPDEGHPGRFRIVGDFVGASQWRVHSFQASPEHIAAVAAAAGRAAPVLFDWVP